MSDPIYAGFWRRALAASLDNLTWLFGVLFIFGSLPINVDQVSGTATGVGVLVVLSLWFNYFAFCEWRWGQTIGKNAFGIEVRSLDGAERLTFSQASARNLLRLVDFFVIGEVMIVADGRRQRLGDKAANTVVVRRAPRAERAAPVPSTETAAIAGAAESRTPRSHGPRSRGPPSSPQPRSRPRRSPGCPRSPGGSGTRSGA